MKRTVLITFFVFFVMTGFVCAQTPYGLAVGAQAPDFTASNHKGKSIQLSSLYNDGPVVLIFYRGGWCHYCNLQLKEYQSHLKDFQELGVSLLAVSVDKQEKAAETVEQKSLGFEVISNPEATLLKDYNLVYQVPEDLAKTYKEKYKIDLEAASGRTDRVIAISAIFVIDQNGTIAFSYANEDYKVRKSAKEILAFLRSSELVSSTP